jgi:hypothetical protein
MISPRIRLHCRHHSETPLFSLNLSDVLLRSLFAMRQSQSEYSTVIEKAGASVTGAIKIGQGHQAQIWHRAAWFDRKKRLI